MPPRMGCRGKPAAAILEAMAICTFRGFFAKFLLSETVVWAIHGVTYTRVYTGLKKAYSAVATP